MKELKPLNMWSTGEEVQAIVKKQLATPKALVDKARAVLGYPS
ncbi:MAG: hypothetical protein VW547_13135 [Alphaproteobacteria bacterium]